MFFPDLGSHNLDKLSLLPDASIPDIVNCRIVVDQEYLDILVRTQEYKYLLKDAKRDISHPIYL